MPRVMVVDDSEPMRVLVRRLLESSDSGFDCVAEANSVDAALGVYAEAHPDVVLLDLNLGGENGFVGAARLLEQDPQARIVLLTGAPSPDVIAAAGDAGLVGVIGKDGLPALADRLRELL